MTRHSHLATLLVALLVALDSLFSRSLVAADITQLTQPTVTPVDGIQFGLHRLPQSSPHPDLVVFSSHSAALVDNDTNNLPDVFLWSRSTGKIQLISAGTNGPANGASFDPALSKDGRFVAFVSSASNLLPDTNKVEDVYIANIATGELELVSLRLQTGVARLGMTRNTVISEDGRYVAFTAARADLLPAGSGTSTREHVLVRDRQAGETIWVNSTLESNAVPGRPVAIREGKLWFFSSTNLYRFDLTTRDLTNIGQSSFDPSFTTDGSKVATQIVSTRTNFVAWYDAATGATNLVFTGPTNRTLRYDSVSIADNGAVAFMAATLDDTNRIADVYVALPGGDPAAPSLVSALPTPPDSIVTASSPLISPDGARIYFKYTTVSKLNSATHVDLYLRDLSSASPQLITTGAYFSKMIRTPAGPLVIGGSGDFSFAAPSNETDLALLPYPPATPPRISLQIAQAADGWRISFHKIPDVTPKVQSADVLDVNAWTDLSIPQQDGGTDWIVIDPTTANQRFYRLLVSP